jgi:hypothetical protein
LISLITAGLLVGAGWTAVQAMRQEDKGKGIGPITVVKLKHGPIDIKTAEAGKGGPGEDGEVTGVLLCLP